MVIMFFQNYTSPLEFDMHLFWHPTKGRNNSSDQSFIKKLITKTEMIIVVQVSG